MKSNSCIYCWFGAYTIWGGILRKKIDWNQTVQTRPLIFIIFFIKRKGESEPSKRVGVLIIGQSACPHAYIRVSTTFLGF